MALIPTYTTPIPAFDLLNELNNIINLINANFAQATGTPAFSGTFVCNGTTPVVVANANLLRTDSILISLNTVGGTVGAIPAVVTITPGTGFNTAGTAADTSTYNYKIIRNTV